MININKLNHAISYLDEKLKPIPEQINFTKKHSRLYVKKNQKRKAQIFAAQTYITQFIQVLFARKIAQSVCSKCCGIGCVPMKTRENDTKQRASNLLQFDCVNCGKFAYRITFGSQSFYLKDIFGNEQFEPSYKSKLDTTPFDIEQSINMVISDRIFTKTVLKGLRYRDGHDMIGNSQFRFPIIDHFHDLIFVLGSFMRDNITPMIVLNYIFDIGISILFN